jgi:mono/diheme cytochrome c family protein
MMTPRLKSIRTLSLLAALCFSPASHADDANRNPLDVKSTFRNICGFCHENYGRKAAKGPQLMNSERSDEFMFNRIKNGMPGRMASFGTAFTDDQIRQIVKFIRNLKPDEEPQNP